MSLDNILTTDGKHYAVPFEQSHETDPVYRMSCNEPYIYINF